MGKRMMGKHLQSVAVLFLAVTAQSAWAQQLPLRDNLILFSCDTKAGQSVSLKSVRKHDGYVLSFKGGKYSANVPAASAYFAYSSRNEDLSFDDGRYIYEMTQFHDGDAVVTITSSKTGNEIQRYECWDNLNMRLDRISPNYFKPYTDDWEYRLQRRFFK